MRDSVQMAQMAAIRNVAAAGLRPLPSLADGVVSMHTPGGKSTRPKGTTMGFRKLTEAAEAPRKSTMLPVKDRLLAEAIGVEVEAAMLRALRQYDAEQHATAGSTAGRSIRGDKPWRADGML